MATNPFELTLTDGPDAVSVRGFPFDIPKTVYALGGNDSISVTDGWETILYMGEGDDVVHANAGITIVYGENGNDRVDMNGGSGSFHGGDGNDIANVFGGTGFGFNGGAGEDRLTIYAAGVPVHFAGGEGSDTLLGTAATLNGQTFSDFARGDRIVLMDAQPQSLQFHITGEMLSFPGGSLTLSGAHNLPLAASEATEGGVEITFSDPPIILCPYVLPPFDLTGMS